MFKKLLSLSLASMISFQAMAEVVCHNSADAGGFQQCEQVASGDPTECDTSTDPIVEKTNADMQPIVCDNQTLTSSGDVSSEEQEEIEAEYNKLCKKKAKAYKKALMGNLLSKGKIGQLVQVLFKKKKRKAFTNGNKNRSFNLDANEFEGKSAEEVEAMILAELEKQSGISGLKEKALLAQSKPAFKLGYHEAETVPLKVVVKTGKKTACQVEVGKLPVLKKAPIKECEFCVEKDIASSFSNDCAYMKNKNYSESDAMKLLNSTTTTDYCNHKNMSEEENNMGPVKDAIKNICDIAQRGMKPDFLIETTRNLWADHTVSLAAKRGEFIQKYVRDQLMNEVDDQGNKKCDLGESAPTWLSDEKEFKKAVRVEHPRYSTRGASGNYGPSPYASTKEEQDKEVLDLETTLNDEILEIGEKKTLAETEHKDINGKLAEFDQKIKTLSAEFNSKAAELKKVKVLDQSIYDKKDQLEHMSHIIQDYNAKKDGLYQAQADLKRQIDGYAAKVIVNEKQKESKIANLKTYYAEKNGDIEEKHDRKYWDTNLFNDFKMVRISGKAVEDSLIPGVDPQYITPAVKIALNALVEVKNFTCVVEPIETHKRTLKGVLKVGAKVLTVLATPVTLAAVTVGAVVASPFTFVGSFMCEGCGDPGNIPPVLKFGNPRALSLGRGGSRVGDAISEGWKAYSTWDGVLKMHGDSDMKTFDNNTQEVWEQQQARKNKKTN